MRIVFISHRFPPNFLGGADLYTYGIADELRRRGHDVSVICAENMTDDSVPPGTVRTADEPYNGLPVHRFYFNWRTMPDPYEAFYVINPAIEAATYSYLRRVRPDVVHITAMGYVSAGVLTAAKRLDLPVILTLTGKWLVCPKGSLLKRDGKLCSGRQDGLTCLGCMFGLTKAYRVLSWLPKPTRPLTLSALEHLGVFGRHNNSFGLMHAVDRRNRLFPAILTGVDCVISPSLCHKQIFEGSQIFDGHEIIYSPYGHQIDLAVQGRYKTPSKRLRFGYTGQIVDYKGIDLAIGAFHMLRDTSTAELHIFGDPSLNPPYMEYLIDLAAGHPRVFFRGVFAHEDIGEILSGIDVILVPSRCVENAPLTIAESFAARTPVVGSDTCGVAEYITEGVNGLKFCRGDASDLAQQMQRLLDEPALLDHLRQGIKPVRTVSDEADALMQIYERQIAAK